MKKTSHLKPKAKLRLDQLLLEREIFNSREKAQAAILAGEVWTSETRLDKAGTLVSIDIEIVIRSHRTPHVSRGGEKLKFALTHFGVTPANKIALDIGASTGGFTDCLIQNGAAHVFSIDVGYGQLDSRLRQDPRVTSLERTNARHLKLADLIPLSPQAKEISLAVADVSFISLSKIIPHLKNEFPSIQEWVLLFKPQFEVGPENLRKGGIVKSTQIALSALDKFTSQMKTLGFKIENSPVLSPIEGKKSGNQEYLLFLQ